MSRGEVGRFVRDYWWQLGALTLLVFGWVVRVEAAVNGLEGLADAQSTVESLARLECLRDRQRATLAGVPCGQLLNEWGLR